MADRQVTDAYFSSDIWMKTTGRQDFFTTESRLAMKNHADGHLANCNVCGGLNRGSYLTDLKPIGYVYF